VRGSPPRRLLYASARLSLDAAVWRGTAGRTQGPTSYESADVTAGIVAAGFSALGCIESPLKGATSGNTEFLAYFRRHAAGGADAPDGDVDAINGL